jgi:hypothetical protein
LGHGDQLVENPFVLRVEGVRYPRCIGLAGRFLGLGLRGFPKIARFACRRVRFRFNPSRFLGFRFRRFPVRFIPELRVRFPPRFRCRFRFLSGFGFRFRPGRGFPRLLL